MNGIVTLAHTRTHTHTHRRTHTHARLHTHTHIHTHTHTLHDLILYPLPPCPSSRPTKESAPKGTCAVLQGPLHDRAAPKHQGRWPPERVLCCVMSKALRIYMAQTSLSSVITKLRLLLLSMAAVFFNTNPWKQTVMCLFSFALSVCFDWAPNLHEQTRTWMGQGHCGAKLRAWAMQRHRPWVRSTTDKATCALWDPPHFMIGWQEVTRSQNRNKRAASRKTRDTKDQEESQQKYIFCVSSSPASAPFTMLFWGEKVMQYDYFTRYLSCTEYCSNGLQSRWCALSYTLSIVHTPSARMLFPHIWAVGLSTRGGGG